jgi:hypothetical protein
MNMALRKKTKRALIASAISLGIGAATLGGATLAWFSDSITTTAEAFKFGNLKLDVARWDGLKYVSLKQTNEDGTVNTEGIFLGQIKLWEPGVTAIERFEIKNTGSLAFDYRIKIKDVTDRSEIKEDILEQLPDLAEAIQVYLYTGNKEHDTLTSFKDVTDNVSSSENWISIGSLRDVLDAKKGIALNQLLSKEVEYVTVVLNMPTSIGNEYNLEEGLNEALTATYQVTFEAMQSVYEKDAFNEYYDEAANNNNAENAMPYYAVSDLAAIQNHASSKVPTRVRLQDNISADEELTVTGNLIIDAAGFKYQGTIIVEDGASLKFVNESENGRQRTSSSYTIICKGNSTVSLSGVTGGEVILEDNFTGNLSSTNSSYTLIDGTNSEEQTTNVATTDKVTTVKGEDGKITIEIEKNSNEITSPEELVAALAKGGEITLASDIELSESLTLTQATTITSVEGSTYTLTSTADSIFETTAPLTLENITLVGKQTLADKTEAEKEALIYGESGLYKKDGKNDYESNWKQRQKYLGLDVAGSSNKVLRTPVIGIKAASGATINLTNVTIKDVDWGISVQNTWENAPAVDKDTSTYAIGTLDNVTIEALDIGINLRGANAKLIKDCTITANTSVAFADAYRETSEATINEVTLEGGNFTGYVMVGTAASGKVKEATFNVNLDGVTIDENIHVWEKTRFSTLNATVHLKNVTGSLEKGDDSNSSNATIYTYTPAN